MAIYFFDSSGIAKRYIAEPGSPWVRSTTSPASGNRIHIVSLTAVEVTAAVVRRQRGGGLTAADAALALSKFQMDLASLLRVSPVSPLVIRRATALAEAHALRGADAVQLAAAVELAERAVTAGLSIVFVSADAELNVAAAAEHLSIHDPTRFP